MREKEVTHYPATFRADRKKEEEEWREGGRKEGKEEEGKEKTTKGYPVKNSQRGGRGLTPEPIVYS